MYKNSKINLFDAIMGDLVTDDFFTFTTFDMPKTTKPVHDVIENDSEYIIDFHLTGIKKDDVSITVENNVLSIKAERHIDDEIKYTHKESFSGVYEKSFELPDTVKTDKINATFIDGIVSVKIPKKSEKNKSGIKKIKIN